MFKPKSCTLVTMAGERRKRVGMLIREEISELLLRKVRDPRIGFVSITEVDLSPDLRVARVFYSVLGSESDRSQAAQGLRSAHGFIKRELASRLNLKFMPEILFILDNSMEQGERMERIFRELEQESWNE
jgi:ribosome-binding factor A